MTTYLHRKNASRVASLLVLSVLTHGCAGADEAANESDQPEVSSEGHVMSSPSWYQQPDLEGATFPLAADDPRAVFKLPEDVYIVENDDLPLPPIDGELINKDIVGGESRVVVSNADTKKHPMSSVVQIIGHFKGRPAKELFRCTGTLIAADAVLTAAHCVWSDKYSVFADSMLAIPGAYPKPGFPNEYVAQFGSSNTAKGFAHASYVGGVNTPGSFGKTGYDMGLLRLNTKVGGTTRVPVVAAPAAKTALMLYGYHGDLAKYQMYSSPGTVMSWEDTANEVFKTDADAYQGVSGGAISVKGENNKIFALLSSGSGKPPETFWNYGVAFDNAKLAKINEWKAWVKPNP